MCPRELTAFEFRSLLHDERVERQFAERVERQIAERVERRIAEQVERLDLPPEDERVLLLRPIERDGDDLARDLPPEVLFR